MDQLNQQLEAKDEKIFELNEQIKTLRNQVTYLQEELASVEDELMAARQQYENRIADLEQQLGNALYRD